MKKIFVHKIQVLAVIVFTMAWTMSACTKEDMKDGSPDIKPGNPQLENITPSSGAPGTLLTLKGSGLGDMRSIIFDKNNAPSLFQSTLNTGTAILFRVPDTATRGPQNIVLTNSQGKSLTIPFDVIPLALVNNAFPSEFESGSTIKLNGNNLDLVTQVILEGTTDEATIISQSLNEMVIQMPASDADKTKLVLTTTGGDKTTDIIFVNVDKALQIFTNDFVNPAQSWSWGGTYSASADDFVSGGKSLKAAYNPAETWGGLQIGMGSELPLPAGTKYFTFWVKGADVEKKVKLQVQGNNWSLSSPEKTLTIPAGKWTYFKEEIATLMPGINSISVILFQIHDEGKTLYFDNIMFIK
ncbi:IPT/TIG domain-containing protein [Agriterribacter sp.]|uniref:IPT/TIG domain-containing protein n=1 Tax=Agriterribacter sp. TaxID=2821509 RepID=UPI002C7A45D5|nr:IPT/TIG domain-containing protein [Agriterribacter sp.]HRO44295.1 hypothetical protein [Agriterribacter sp.]HRQ18235.1 hypothetical protein [Agriterribacter sp.]